MSESLVVAGLVGVVLGTGSQIAIEAIKRGIWGNQQNQAQVKIDHTVCEKHEAMYSTVTQTAADSRHIITSIERVEKKVDQLFEEAFKRIRTLEKQVSGMIGPKGIKVDDDTAS
jgi:hypothetical protein